MAQEPRFSDQKKNHLKSLKNIQHIYNIFTMTSSVIFLFLFKPIISIILYELVSQRFVVIKNLSIT